MLANVTPGSTIDFAVYTYGVYFGGTTPLIAQISLNVPSVPAPATASLFAAAACVWLLAGRRRIGGV